MSGEEYDEFFQKVENDRIEDSVDFREKLDEEGNYEHKGPLASIEEQLEDGNELENYAEDVEIYLNKEQNTALVYDIVDGFSAHEDIKIDDETLDARKLGVSEGLYKFNFEEGIKGFSDLRELIQDELGFRYAGRIGPQDFVYTYPEDERCSIILSSHQAEIRVEDGYAGPVPVLQEEGSFNNIELEEVTGLNKPVIPEEFEGRDYTSK